MITAHVRELRPHHIGAVQLRGHRHIRDQRAVQKNELSPLGLGDRRLHEGHEVEVAAPRLIVTQRQGPVRPDRLQGKGVTGVGDEAVQEELGGLRLVGIHGTDYGTVARPRG